MQSHIVCIFTVFSPEWVFKCVLKLPVWTDAKLHWLHLCEFSPEWVFLWFVKSLEVTCAKSHCLHLYDISPEWVFKCVLKLPVWTDVKLHWLHVCDFSSVWVFLWFLKSLVLNEFSNAPANCRYKHMQSCIGYIYAIFPQCDFPEWIFKCAFKGKVTLVACVRLFSGASFLVSP